MLLSATKHRALLPGRSRWIEVCHADPAVCSRCLGTISHFLAVEMDFDATAAIERSSVSYQAELGADRCTLEQARELRRRTVAWCCYTGDLNLATLSDVTLADDSLAEVASR